MQEKTRIRIRKSANHFHIDDETLASLHRIREKLLPPNIPFRDVDIIRAAVKYLSMEVALRHPSTVYADVCNIKQGAIDGNRITFIYAPARKVSGDINLQTPSYKAGKQEIINDVYDYNPDESKL